jgi:hypothetical protein
LRIFAWKIKPRKLTIAKGLCCRPGRILPSEEVKDKRNNQTEEDTGGKWKVKGKIAPMDVNIAWEPAEPGHLRAGREQQAERDQQDTE